MYSKKLFLHSTKKVYLLLLFFSLFMNCEKESHDIDEMNYADPNGSVSEVIKYEEIETNKFLNYSEGLDYVMKDEDGLLKLNNIKLLSYELIEDYKHKEMESFDNYTLIPERQDFKDTTTNNYTKEALNKYSVNVVNNSNEANKDFLLKKEKFISNILTNTPDLKLVDLKWLVKGEMLSTIAYFKEGKLLYDDILSNYVILNIEAPVNDSINKNNPINKTTYTANNGSLPYGYNCWAQYYSHDIPIGYTVGMFRYSLSSPLIGETAHVTCYISFRGIQSQSSCTKYLNTAYVSKDYGGSAWASADANVQMDFKGFSPYTGPGYCNYSMAVALQSKPFWSNIKISLTFAGSGFTFTANPNGGEVLFRQKFGSVTATNLN